MKTITTFALGAVLLFAAEAGNAAPMAGPGYRGHKGADRFYGAPDYRRPVFRDRMEVKAQLRLRELGYYRGSIDGVFGRGSTQALLRFQRDHRLPRTGVLDARTTRALRLR